MPYKVDAGKIAQRENAARRVCNLVVKHCIPQSVMLVGRDAHSLHMLGPDTDMDMVVVSSHVGQFYLTGLVSYDNLENLPKGFDGYCFKFPCDGVEISLHFLSPSTSDRIADIQPGYLRLFRQKKKSGNYTLFNFKRESYSFPINSRELDGGFEIYSPLGLEIEGKFYVGVHRDKILSKPIILYAPDNSVDRRIDNLWQAAVKRLIKESVDECGGVNLDSQNILNSLYRKDIFSDEAKTHVTRTAQKHIAQMESNSIAD